MKKLYLLGISTVAMASAMHMNRPFDFDQDGGSDLYLTPADEGAGGGNSQPDNVVDKDNSMASSAPAGFTGTMTGSAKLGAGGTIISGEMNAQPAESSRDERYPDPS